MATEVKLPRLGQGMESGTIVKWLKSEGEQVQKGDALYELDTDKVTQEVEAEASGVLLKIAVSAGEVEVGKTIGFIGAPGEAVADSPDGDSAREPAPTVEQTAADVPAAARSTSSATIRPSGPVPTRPRSSTPRSRAASHASGEALIRSPFAAGAAGATTSTGAAAIGAAAATGAAAGAATS